MKKRFATRCLALGLILAMGAGLCSCGNGGKMEADPSLAKENVYRLQNIELPELYNPENGDMNVMASAHNNGRVQLLVKINDWSGGNYNDYDYRVISMNEDGSDVQIVSLEIPNPNAQNQDKPVVRPDIPTVEPRATEEDDTASEDGDNSGEDDTASEDGDNSGEGGNAEDDPAVEDPVEEPSNIWENIWFSSFSMTEDGTVYAQKVRRAEDYTDPENTIRINEMSICSWGADGKKLWESSLGDLGDRAWINQMLAGSDKALYLLLQESNEDYTDTSCYKIRVETDGSVGERQELSEDVAKIFTSTADQMVPKGDGTVFVVYRDENDWTKMYYTFYDVATDKLEEGKDFPSSISYSYDYNVMIPGLSHDLIYTGNGGLYFWDQGQESGKLMVNFINSDLYIESIYNIVEIDKDTFLAFYREDWQSGMKAGIFTYVKPEDIQDKEVLVLAGNWINDNLKKRVIEYNRNNAEYRIVIKEYNSYNSYDDYQAGMNQLNNDIISGNMPDILVNQSYNSLPVENYVSKGLLADIDKLIAEDEELSQVEFMQNAFDAYRVNGKLYSIVPDFEVYTMIAKKSLVGNRENWTMEDMQQVVAGMGENAKAFDGETTQNAFIDRVMRYCGNQFVDISTGKCSFNTEDFVSMLEYAKALPSDDKEGEGYDEDYWNDYWQNYQSQYRQNRTLLLEANFYRFDGLAYTINGRMGEDVSYTGFPTETGNGSYIMSSITYILSAKSKNLDEAWNFMRYVLTEEAQQETDYFPVQKDMFYEKSKEATKVPTYEWTDENGEVHVEEENMTIWINDEAVPYEPLSQEQLDEFIAFVESVHNPYYYNEEIMKIISEEIGGYFTGQKPAADVADVIQRRVQNYVDER